MKKRENTRIEDTSTPDEDHKIIEKVFLDETFYHFVQKRGYVHPTFYDSKDHKNLQKIFKNILSNVEVSRIIEGAAGVAEPIAYVQQECEEVGKFTLRTDSKDLYQKNEEKGTKQNCDFQRQRAKDVPLSYAVLYTRLHCTTFRDNKLFVTECKCLSRSAAASS